MRRSIHITEARRILGRGQPVTLTIVKKNGTVIDIPDTISIRFDTYTGIRTIKNIRSGAKRTIHDVQIIALDDFEVFI